MSVEGMQVLKTDIAAMLRDAVATGSIRGEEAGAVLVFLLAKMVAQTVDEETRVDLVVTIVENFSAAVQFEMDNLKTNPTMETMQ